MQLNKLTFLAPFLLTGFSLFADVPLSKPKSEKEPIAKPVKEILPTTKYYFANVDSFTEYKFLVKKTDNNKTYKIKQDASFVINPNAGNENNTLEVWAVNKKDNQQTNSFTLTGVKHTESFEFNTAYVAIVFQLDKNKKLSYKQTYLKPDCYSSKKQIVPLLSFKHSNGNINQLIFISLFSVLVLFTVFISNKIKQRAAYV